MKRRNFLKALPAAALTLAGCGQNRTAPANTASLVFDHSYPLDYATQFSADCYEGGYVMIDIPDAGRFLVVPEGAAEVDDLPEDVVLLRQPLDHIYLVSTSVMDLFVHLDALDSIALSGTKAEGWYVEEARQAMQEGRIAYAGKYSAPDYERILAAGCTLAIENTMVLHDPEVKEQLEKFGVPVLVERSSYESGPLARMEWLKLYGILLNKTEMAEEVFRQKVEQVAPILEQENTGKTAAFFSITTNNLITVRRTSDYVAQMVEMAGGVYIFDDLEGETSAQSTIKLPLETSLPGQITQTSPYGRDVNTCGWPIRICEMLATLEAPAYLERVTVNNVKNVKNAKKAIEKAFRYQVEGKGFSLIEVLSACPTNWGLTPQKALEWINEKMIPYYPLGVYKDVTAEEAEA